MREDILRKIARRDLDQIIYVRAKELNIKLFKNNYNLSKTQVQYLYWLEVYNGLYTDLAMGEDYMYEDLIDDDLRCEAYLLLRGKLRKDKKYKERLDKEINKNETGIPTIIFKNKGK